MPYMEAGWRFGMQEICNREIIYPLAPVEVIPDQQYFDVAKIHKHVCASSLLLTGTRCIDVQVR